MKDFPWATMPTGWFQIAWSAELQVGDVKAMHYFGRDLVAYRGESGQVHVLDAHCAHLGAHLGVGGTVAGDDIICPFHHWRWSCEGCTVDIPYSARKTQAKRIGTWPVRELEPYVFVWHDLAGAPPRLPASAGLVRDEPARRRNHRRRRRGRPRLLLRCVHL